MLEPPKLKDYLTKLFCIGYSRRCPLTNPSCAVGRNRQTEEVQRYNEMYGTNETYTLKNR